MTILCWLDIWEIVFMAKLNSYIPLRSSRGLPDALTILKYIIYNCVTTLWYKALYYTTPNCVMIRKHLYTDVLKKYIIYNLQHFPHIS